MAHSPVPYHHGALRQALIDATEALLAEKGADGFSLREVARRAGVSAAAPAHHFGDASGLLTAVATLGFEGLTKEHAKMLEETSPDLVDAVDLGAAARTENYEIAAYETLRRMAKALGENDAVDLLDENLKQEKAALATVEKIATRVANEQFAGSPS